MLGAMARTIGVMVVMNKRPRAHVAVLEGTKQTPAAIELFVLTTSENDLVDQIHDLASALSNRLNGLAIERAMIRRADTPQRPSNQEGPRARLLVEGALLRVTRDQVQATRVMNGRDIAALAGGGRTKATLDVEAQQLVSSPEYAPAAAAAFALLDD
jgi:hypothetical protein